MVNIMPCFCLNIDNYSKRISNRTPVIHDGMIHWSKRNIKVKDSKPKGYEFIRPTLVMVFLLKLWNINLHNFNVNLKKSKNPK